MKIKEISTLEGVEIKNLRNCGNTTRQVNQAIEYLFQGYRVIVLDHHDMGKNHCVNRYLLGRIIDRLKKDYPYMLYKCCPINNTIQLVDAPTLIKNQMISEILEDYRKSLLCSDSDDFDIDTINYVTINRINNVFNN